MGKHTYAHTADRGVRVWGGGRVGKVSRRAGFAGAEWGITQCFSH